MFISMLVVNRQQLLTKALDLENSVRCSLKVFGLRVGVVTRKQFEARVLELVSDDRILLAITEPMLRVRRALVEEFERLDSLCQQLARRDPVWRWNLAEAASITKKCADHSSSR